MEVKIKATLKAYTKGVIPDVSGFITDCDDDGKIYVRKYGEWLQADKVLDKTVVEEGKGISVDKISENTYKVSAKEKDFTQTEFENSPDYYNLEADTIYYIADQTANNFTDGGTAFSNGNNEFVDLSEFTEYMNGGNADSIANIIINPLDSKGVYNG